MLAFIMDIIRKSKHMDICFWEREGDMILLGFYSHIKIYYYIQICTYILYGPILGTKGVALKQIHAIPMNMVTF